MTQNANEPLYKMMSTNPHEELFRILLDAAEGCPLPVLGDCAELIATVLARRLHDELIEMPEPEPKIPADLIESFGQPWPE